MIKFFEFEHEVEKIETLLNQLKNNKELNFDKIKKLKKEKDELFKKIYSNLDPWQKVQVSRHGERPHTLDYIQSIFNNIVLLHGDKKYADDNAIVGGLAEIDGNSVFFIGTEKGNTMETRIKHNFGMAKPEGYRKVQRLLKLAEKFKLPLISFVGKDAEERGQSESIASSILQFLKTKIPTISIIIGEGGSGGAIGIATSDRVLMLEHSIYSVISPEGCASILWRNTQYSQEAAKTLKLTSADCKNFKIIDDIIPEPYGGAHRYPKKQAEIIKEKIISIIKELKQISIKELVQIRKEKYLNITSEI